MSGPVIAVAWQSRFVDGKWSECSREHVEWVRSVPHEWPGYEVRELYAAPQPAPAIDLGPLHALIAEIDDECGNGKPNFGRVVKLAADAAELSRALIDGQPTKGEGVADGR